MNQIFFNAALGDQSKFCDARDLGDDGQEADGACAYHESWFVKIAARRQWVRGAKVRRRGRVVACLNYVVSLKKGPFLFGRAPHWSHLNGPVVDPSLSPAEQAAVLRELVGKLPRWISLQFICGPRDDNQALLAAFAAAGFRHEHQITYREKPDDPDVMALDNEQGFSRKRRGNINRARKRITISEDLSAGEFVRFFRDNLHAAGLKSCYPLGVAQDLIARGQALNLDGRLFLNEAGEMRAAKRIVVFAAHDKDAAAAGGRGLLGAIVCLFDERNCYYWLTTRRRCQDGTHGDAIKVLILHARRRARELGLTFDADGVNTPGSQELYTKLKFPHAARRDVFVRTTPVAGILYRHRNEIMSYVKGLRPRWRAGPRRQAGAEGSLPVTAE